jgi:hypothetical protein
MRMALVLTGLIAVAAPAAPAFAQECHPLPATRVPAPAPTERGADGALREPTISMRAGFAVETAAIDDGLGRSGNYRGAVTSIEVMALGTRARVSLGAYEVDWGQQGRGLGDAHIALQRAVVAVGPTDIGVALSATLPTGDVAAELGMGHPMVMPAAWARWSGESSSVLGSVVYGSMLGGHHHGAPAPIQSPMNAEEIAAALRLGRTFGRTELSTSVSGAIPIGDGVARAAVGGAARWLFGATELGVDVSTPFGGTPIQARGVVEISRGF